MRLPKLEWDLNPIRPVLYTFRKYMHHEYENSSYERNSYKVLRNVSMSPDKGEYGAVFISGDIASNIITLLYWLLKSLSYFLQRVSFNQQTVSSFITSLFRFGFRLTTDYYFTVGLVHYIIT